MQSDRFCSDFQCWFCTRLSNVLQHYTDNWTCDWLLCYSWEVMDCRPYYLSLMPIDFHLFGPLKKHQAHIRFAVNT